MKLFDSQYDEFKTSPNFYGSNRLDQSLFHAEQDEGWCSIFTTTPTDRHIKNPGCGLIAYTWEENGPAVAVRNSQETLEQSIEKIASLPFVDVLYIRCDWCDVQSNQGELDLKPVWEMTFDAARRHGLKVAFRVQSSSPNFQPKHFSLPGFLLEKIPMISIGPAKEGCEVQGDFDFYEPQYDHPEFLKAFKELNQLLAERFDGDPILEFVDLMMYGFWGEGHTQNLPNPFKDYWTAEKTTLEMTRVQLEIWKKTPLVVNLQPDISKVGNRAVYDLAVNNGCWIRTDSIIHDEPIQLQLMANRPPQLAAIVEDGYYRHYPIEEESLPKDIYGVNILENEMLHVLDAGANYWSLWTEADRLKEFYEKYPLGFDRLSARMGYRIRPSWIWQRRRNEAMELIVAISNDGVASVPGRLHLCLQCENGTELFVGSLDCGYPHAGKLKMASFLLPKELAGMSFLLSAKIEMRPGIVKSIKWACNQHIENNDEFVLFETVSYYDTRFRKGI